MDLLSIASQTRTAAGMLARTTPETRNAALAAMADALAARADEIRAANEQDLAAARREGLAAPLLHRLSLDDKKIAGLVSGLRSLQSLPDPIGQITVRTELSPGLVLERISCPIGVIGIVFESRPDAFVQIASLCLKSGNACLLKGGREALQTNRKLRDVLLDATASVGIPRTWMALLESRDEVQGMLSLDRYIDLIIPRGSNEFVRQIQASTHIPVLGHSAGICHLYVDADADAEMAVRIAVDAKTQAPATCNSIETLLVHSEIAPAFLPALKTAMDARSVRLLGDDRTRTVIPCDAATESDWDTEYLDTILSVKIVDSADEAVRHINRHGSRHTDAIVTENKSTAETFLAAVDSADVFWNCSTRFADGYRFGLGAEIGISTGKIHARGPVGLEGIMTYKWLLRGHGETVAPFADGSTSFTHRPLPL